MQAQRDILSAQTALISRGAGADQMHCPEVHVPRPRLPRAPPASQASCRRRSIMWAVVPWLRSRAEATAERASTEILDSIFSTPDELSTYAWVMRTRLRGLLPLPYQRRPRRHCPTPRLSFVPAVRASNAHRSPGRCDAIGRPDLPLPGLVRCKWIWPFDELARLAGRLHMLAALSHDATYWSGCCVGLAASSDGLVL